MKPTPPNSISHSSKRDQRPSKGRLTFPKNDYAYHTTFPEPGVVGSPAPMAKEVEEAHTFRSISRHFMNAGSMREYLAEALFFGWITLTAAWPLGLLVRQLSTLTFRP
jgi:hypothetical protein